MNKILIFLVLLMAIWRFIYVTKKNLAENSGKQFRARKKQEISSDENIVRNMEVGQTAYVEPGAVFALVDGRHYLNGDSPTIPFSTSLFCLKVERGVVGFRVFIKESCWTPGERETSEWVLGSSLYLIYVTEVL